MFDWYWVFVFYFVILHCRAAVLTIYLHRGIIHETLVITSKAEAIFKFFAWTNCLYFDNYKKFLKAQHSKHHDESDKPNDPHSPYYYTPKQLLDIYHNEPGRPYYVSPEDFAKYSSHMQINETWLDKNLYQPYQNKGYWLWYPIIFCLYGPIGLLISIVILRYLLTELYLLISNFGYHKIGYKTKGGNRRDKDQARNVFPIGILFAGEELHSNHHNFPGSAKFSRRWFEFDMGWFYIKILEKLKLVRVRH